MRNLDRFGSNPTVQVWPISPRARRLLPLESAPPPIRRRLPPPSAATFFPVPLPRGNFALFTLPQLLLPPPPRPQPPNPSWPAPSSPPPGDRRSPETRKKLSAARSYSYREAYISSELPMATEKKVNKLSVANLTSDDSFYPVIVPGNSKIEIQSRVRNLTVYAIKIPGSVAYNAMLLYSEGQQEKCLAVRRRSEHAHTLYEILRNCSHRNIIQPMGVWEEMETNLAFIVFPCSDGVVTSIPKEALFDVEDATNAESYTFGFSDQGCRIFREICMAVRYINVLYDEEKIPLKALDLDESKIFYQSKAKGDYHVLLTDIKMEISPTGNVRKNRRAKGKVSSTGVPTVDDVKTANWNGLGQFLKKLHKDLKLHIELSHLSEELGKESVKYEDLVWEPGLWESSTKVQLVRDVYWCYNKNKNRISTLKNKTALGLKSFIDKLEVNKSRAPDKQINDDNLYESLFFLRVYMVAHKDDTIKGYSGTMEMMHDKKAIVRLLMIERPEYMVTLISAIRKLGWIRQSPFCAWITST
ncbi:uncharacterized protein [Oryza sativa Japonica Group]|nr:uncharacterized protein LOC4350579 [Oryza sativa Japonica Group]